MAAQFQTIMTEVVDVKLVAMVVVLLFLAVVHGTYRGIGKRKDPTTPPTLDLLSGMESLKAELPGVLRAVLPSLLDEALVRGDALPQDGANLVVQAFREELPQALQKLLPEMLPDLLAEAKKGATTGEGDGGASGPSLTQEMLKNTMDQCLDEKWLTTRQGQQEDFDKVVQIASTAQLKKYLDKHKEVQQSVEALTKQVGDADPNACAGGQDGTGAVSNAGRCCTLENRGCGDECQVPPRPSEQRHGGEVPGGGDHPGALGRLCGQV